jgi:hypothetical protein
MQITRPALLLVFDDNAAWLVEPYGTQELIFVRHDSLYDIVRKVSETLVWHIRGFQRTILVWSQKNMPGPLILLSKELALPLVAKSIISYFGGHHLRLQYNNKHDLVML